MAGVDSSSSSDLHQARQRIHTAFEPQLFHKASGRLAQLLADHFEQVQHSQARVLNWEDPETNVQRALEELASSPETDPLPDQNALAERFASVVQAMLQRGQNLHDPRYLGHQVPASVPLAGLFDAVGSVTNQVMAAYEMGPWATSVEHALVRELGQRIGWAPGTFSGLVTHGGSLANLTALLTARNVALPDAWEQGIQAPDHRAVIVVHDDAHYSVTRAAGVLGLGTQAVIRTSIDEHRRLDPIELDRLLTRLAEEGRRVIAVSACACATPTGAFDPLPQVAEVCRRHQVWLHVDAAHGGAVCLSSRHRHLVEGLALADSVVIDAHKMLFVPALCAFVFYKNREHRFQAFRQDAPYLFDPSAPGLAEYDSGLRTFECTKRAAVFGLWGVWRTFGPSLFADLVDVTFDLAVQLHAKLQTADDFEPLHRPECNIVAFRHIPAQLREAPPEQLGAFQLELRRRTIQSGDFYLVPWKLDGVGALRVTLINPLTNKEHLDQLLDVLRRHGQEMLR